MHKIAYAMAFACLVGGTSRVVGDEPERKAVAYLAAEVPRWARENHCYSCHNNGDAARALFRAREAGLAVDPSALTDTVAWLSRPEAWEKNGGDGPSSDKRLARIEFALALATAVEAGQPGLRDALGRAADRLAADQSPDGSWPAEDGGTVGSPATYGRRLATALAGRVLRRADARRHAEQIDRAVRWVRSGRVASVVDAAAVLLTEPGGPARPSEAAQSALEFLRKSQGKSGGWGPYPDTPAEPFDTALALIASASLRDDPAVAASLARGRAALVAMPRPAGSWPETTRPGGGESYAQRRPFDLRLCDDRPALLAPLTRATPGTRPFGRVPGARGVD